MCMGLRHLVGDIQSDSNVGAIGGSEGENDWPDVEGMEVLAG